MRKTNACEWIGARRFSAATVGLALCTTVAALAAPSPEKEPNQQKFKRAAPEVAVGGITREERVARLNKLHARLIVEMPDGALHDPISVELTEQDRADLATPYESGAPLRIGVVKAISPGIRVAQGKGFNGGETRETADGGFVWAVTVTSPDAKAIRVHFTNFALPRNTEIYFFSPDGAVDGPYVGKGRNNNGDFWTRSLSSDTGVIQLRFSGKGAPGAREEISFTVSELAHIHDRQHLEPDEGRGHDTWPCSNNAVCLVDANCVSGNPADPAKDAVAKMEWIVGPSVFTCSGGLLVDTVPASQIPYFLTANHCTSTSIANLETWFNYTTDSCNGICPHNILTGGAPPSDTIGFTVLATSATSDFTLGTLNQAPPAGAVFLGWNNAPVAFTNGAELHRISNANFGPQVYSQQDVDTGSPVCGGLARGNFIYSDTNTGATLGGSSGSPVVNAASEVVGQLFGCCGFNCADDCASAPTNWTVDGAFAVTFPSVEEFLDPPAAGCTSDPDCDDGLFCNGAETCDIPSGNCLAGTPPNCDDGVACTDDSCNEGTDSCDNVANNANCDDGLFCNGSETCDPVLNCQAGTAPNCDDGVACTDDSCNEGTDTCDNIPNNANCPDDGLFCNGTEFCDPVNDCSSTGDPCGGAACDEGTDTCAGATAQLEAGSVSVGGSDVTVNLTNTYVSPVVVCTIQYNINVIPVVTRVSGVTSNSFDVRIENPSGSLIDPENVSYLVVEEGTWNIDGFNVEAQTYLSTVTDENNSWVGEAQAYNQAYTDPAVMGQVMTTNDANWSVFWCQGDARTSPPSAGFLRTGKTVCEDSITARANETVGFIVFEAGHGTIGGVEFEAALGADTILGVGNAPPYPYTFNTPFASAPQIAVGSLGGMDGGNGGWGQIHGPTLATTTTMFLSVDEDQILDAERSHISEQFGYAVFESAVVFPSAPACTVPADCDDGLFCNGAEDCVAGNCVAGTPPNCNDGVGCTDDSCNEGTDSCDNIANNANCDDGLFCNGAETCDPVLDCQSGTAPNCDDGVGCTDDSCNEGTDSCDNIANNANCDDGLFCDGVETCDPVLDCQSGTAPNCDDGVGCTDDSCNEGTDSCDNIANNANCPDDGLFCNGTEFCDAVADCSSTGDPCSGGEVCNETTDTCDPVGGGAQMETGTVTAGGTAVTVNLVNSYASPVVVCTVNYSNNTIPVVTRVSAVTSTSFDVRLQNAGSGSVAAETVHYIVVEEGTWTIDGVNIEAQTYTSTVTDENNSWIGEAQTYGQAYTTPVVLGQVMSEIDADWSVFWNQGTSRTTPPSASSLVTGKTVCEDTFTTRANETIGFIVIEAGSGTINGVVYEAALGADSVRGVTNAPPYTYTFGSAFGSTPQVGIVTMAAVDGGNGGWAYLFGTAPLSATSMDLVIDEDTIGDAERNHTPEQVFYVVFELPVVFP